MAFVAPVVDAINRLLAAGSPGLTRLELRRWKTGVLGGTKQVTYLSDPCWFVGDYDWQTYPDKDSDGLRPRQRTCATPDGRLLLAPPGRGESDASLSGLSPGYPYLYKHSDYALVSETLLGFLRL